MPWSDIDLVVKADEIFFTGDQTLEKLALLFEVFYMMKPLGR